MANPLAPVGLLVILGLAGGAASAQTPPTQAELSAYRGLHAAAAQGSVDDVRRLGKVSVDPNSRDQNGRTPLHVAAFQGHGAAARALVAAGADPSLLDNQRYDAVTIAAVRDDIPTLKALLASGASAKLITSVYDGTALIAAAHLGHDGIVRELIQAGAPLNHVNNLGWTALIEAVILGDGGTRHTETVRALLAAGADARIPDRNGATPLQLAQARGYGGMVSLLRGASDR
ncbi:ankyrin repeat domain-containing protein [Microvirga zambiensis]|uniref:ankyrin repeat domain-containing protein n=1 Tax=Microvirga zambiensis TaxID=1402137 RepID=UPI00191F893A|nr:ankyrin repeat domain-containing protein [Microvirga zambiensis]